LILSHTVTPDNHRKTVKHILKKELKLSERLVKKLKFDNKILLNGLPVHVNQVAAAGDRVEAVVEFDEECGEFLQPEAIPLDILYEDESLIAVNKPAGMVVHPTSGHTSGTAANALLHHFKKSGQKCIIRPVSRLDRDTSGIILFAKNQYVQDQLIRQMKQKTFEKEYLGIVWGHPDEMEGTIDLPIERLPGSIMLRHVSPTGASSITHFTVLELFSHTALLQFSLETGRTHQIRVHCQATGHPLVGDTLYFLPEYQILESPIQRQALHSFRVSLEHPLTGTILELAAPLPSDMSGALEILRNNL